MSHTKQWIRCCVYIMCMIGDKRHPQQAIRDTYPDAECFCPESIANAWFFRATPTGAEGEPGIFTLAPRYAESPVAQAALRDKGRSAVMDRPLKHADRFYQQCTSERGLREVSDHVAVALTPQRGRVRIGVVLGRDERETSIVLEPSAARALALRILDLVS